MAFYGSSPGNEFIKAIYLGVNIRAIIIGQITFTFKDIITYIY